MVMVIRGLNMATRNLWGIQKRQAALLLEGSSWAGAVQARPASVLAQQGKAKTR